MDANLLRIILIILGALTIAGVYWWERRRHLERDSSKDTAEDLPARPEPKSTSREPRGAADPGEAPAAARSPEAAPAPMLIVVHVLSRSEPFDGAAIVHAAGHCGLEPGDMDIFHCVLGEGPRRQTLFSMANLINPGTFPFGAMADFHSPGLTLFARITGSPDDPGRIEELLGTAHTLATELQASLLDEQRQPLTVEKEDRLRERAMALVHRRLTSTG